MAIKKNAILITAAVLLITMSFAVAACAADVSVSDEENLRDMLTAGNSVTLTADIQLTNGNITLSTGTPAHNLNGFSLTAAQNQRVFDIRNDAAFTLTDTSGGGKVAGNGIVSENGAGIYIHSGGVFIMNSGCISGFQTEKDGGGVGIADGTFTMNGGTITGCSAAGWSGGGGVYVGCSTDEEGYVLNYGVFTMNGGTITNCEATDDFGSGGGICAENTFTMNSGTITNCRATGMLGNGGGIAIKSGPFTMTNAMITDCVSKSNGGGVSISFGDFTMTKSTITGCSAGDGAGVSYSGWSSFAINDGIIKDNTAESGTGIYSISPVNVSGITELSNVELLKLGDEYYIIIAENGFSGSVQNIKLSSAETREENPSEWLGQTIVKNGASVKNSFTLSTSSLYDGYELAVNGADLVLAEKTKQTEKSPASPAPFAGLLAGLGTAAVFFGLRRK
ncbi:MAG TPA: hypothetical protein O0X42_04595 [Methanocorpusculum sp.]|nr:hypothetical protein [Methanocorpusculum sp.]